MSFCASVCLSICLSVCLSVFLCNCLSVFDVLGFGCSFGTFGKYSSKKVQVQFSPCAFNLCDGRGRAKVNKLDSGPEKTLESYFLSMHALQKLVGEFSNP